MKVFKKLTCIALAAISISAISLPVSADWGKTDDGASYYTLEDGSKAVGFTEIDGDTYYFKKDGTMLTGSYKISGAYYRFGSDGKMYKGFAKNKDGDYFYYAADGKRASGWTEIKGAKYYFTGKGVMLKGASYKIDGEVYKFGADGKLVVPGAAQTTTTATGGFFLDGFFGESPDAITKRNPAVLSVIDDPEIGISIDLTYKSLKLGNTNAIGVHAYVFMESKYVMGMLAYAGTSETVPGSVLGDDFEATPFTKSQITAIYDAYVKQYTAKYGEPETIDEADYSDETYAEFTKAAMFESGSTVYMIVASDEYVAIIGMDSSASENADVDTLLELVK